MSSNPCLDDFAEAQAAKGEPAGPEAGVGARRDLGRDDLRLDVAEECAA